MFSNLFFSEKEFQPHDLASLKTITLHQVTIHFKPKKVFKCEKSFDCEKDYRLDLAKVENFVLDKRNKVLPTYKRGVTRIAQGWMNINYSHMTVFISARGHIRICFKKNHSSIMKGMLSIDKYLSKIYTDIIVPSQNSVFFEQNILGKTSLYITQWSVKDMLKSQNIVFICKAFTELLKGDNYVQSKASCNVEPQLSENMKTFSDKDAKYINQLLHECNILLYTHQTESAEKESKVSITKNLSSLGGTTQDLDLLLRIDEILHIIDQMKSRPVNIQSLMKILQHYLDDMSNEIMNFEIEQIYETLNHDSEISQYQFFRDHFLTKLKNEHVSVNEKLFKKCFQIISEKFKVHLVIHDTNKCLFKSSNVGQRRSTLELILLKNGYFYQKNAVFYKQSYLCVCPLHKSVGHFSCGVDTILSVFQTALYFCKKRIGILSEMAKHFSSVRNHSICDDRNQIWDKINEFMDEKSWSQMKGTRKLPIFDFFTKVFREHLCYRINTNCVCEAVHLREISQLFVYGSKDYDAYGTNFSKYITDKIIRRAKFCANDSKVQVDDLICIQFVNDALNVQLNDSTLNLKLYEVHDFKLIAVIYNQNSEHWLCCVSNETGFYHIDRNLFMKLDDMKNPLLIEKPNDVITSYGNDVVTISGVVYARNCNLASCTDSCNFTILSPDFQKNDGSILPISCSLDHEMQEAGYMSDGSDNTNIPDIDLDHDLGHVESDLGYAQWYINVWDDKYVDMWQTDSDQNADRHDNVLIRNEDYSQSYAHICRDKWLTHLTQTDCLDCNDDNDHKQTDGVGEGPTVFSTFSELESSNNQLEDNEKIYFDYSLASGKPTSAMFKTNRVDEWVRCLSDYYKTEPKSQPNGVRDIKLDDILFKCYLNGVILIEGSLNHILRWVLDKFLNIQSRLNNSENSNAITLKLILSSMNSSISDSPKDGHCLLHSICQSWNSLGKGHLTTHDLCTFIESVNGAEYAKFIGLDYDQYKSEINSYINMKDYASDSVDIIPYILANVLQINISILVEHFDGICQVVPIHPCTDPTTDEVIYVHKIGEHFNGVIPLPVSAQTPLVQSQKSTGYYDSPVNCDLTDLLNLDNDSLSNLYEIDDNEFDDNEFLKTLDELDTKKSIQVTQASNDIDCTEVLDTQKSIQVTQASNDINYTEVLTDLKTNLDSENIIHDSINTANEAHDSINDINEDLQSFKKKIIELFNSNKHMYRNYFQKENKFLFQVVHDCLKFNDLCVKMDLENFISHVKNELIKNCDQYKMKINEQTFNVLINDLEKSSLNMLRSNEWSFDCLSAFFETLEVLFNVNTVYTHGKFQQVICEKIQHNILFIERCANGFFNFRCVKADELLQTVQTVDEPCFNISRLDKHLYALADDSEQTSQITITELQKLEKMATRRIKHTGRTLSSKLNEDCPVEKRAIDEVMNTLLTLAQDVMYEQKVERKKHAQMDYKLSKVYKKTASAIQQLNCPKCDSCKLNVEQNEIILPSISKIYDELCKIKESRSKNLQKCQSHTNTLLTTYLQLMHEENAKLSSNLDYFLKCVKSQIKTVKGRKADVKKFEPWIKKLKEKADENFTALDDQYQPMALENSNNHSFLNANLQLFGKILFMHKLKIQCNDSLEGLILKSLISEGRFNYAKNLVTFKLKLMGYHKFSHCKIQQNIYDCFKLLTFILHEGTISSNLPSLKDKLFLSELTYQVTCEDCNKRTKLNEKSYSLEIQLGENSNTMNSAINRHLKNDYVVDKYCKNCNKETKQMKKHIEFEEMASVLCIFIQKSKISNDKNAVGIKINEYIYLSDRRYRLIGCIYQYGKETNAQFKCSLFNIDHKISCNDAQIKTIYSKQFTHLSQKVVISVYARC